MAQKKKSGENLIGQHKMTKYDYLDNKSTSSAANHVDVYCLEIIDIPSCGNVYNIYILSRPNTMDTIAFLMNKVRTPHYFQMYY